MLTSHPKVRLVGFTGSTEVGKILMRQASTTVKKVALELGAMRHSSSSTMPTSMRPSKVQCSRISQYGPDLCLYQS